MVRGPLPALLLTPLLLASVPAAQGPSSEAVNAAIERGVGYLLRSQNRDGSWGVDLYERGTVWHDLRDGATALAAYTLLKCGFQPDHPSIQRAAAFLVEGSPHHTYATGIQLHTLGAIDPVAHKKRMQGLVALLEDLRQNNGWDYPGIGRPDLSNTQVAALGFRAANAAGLAVPKGIWGDMVDIALRYQERPVDVPGEGLPKEKRRMAGFSYEPGGKASASMTTAGLTILGIASEDPSRSDYRLDTRIEEARQLALNWLEQNFSIEGNPGGEAGWHYYYLYGLERVGAFFGLERIGAHDWYQEGAAQLIRSQRDAGGWWLDGRARWVPAPMPIANTCFALLFLRKATLSPKASRTTHFSSMEAPESDVWVRVDAKQVWTLWLSGFAPAILEQYPLADDGTGRDFFVERVEWWIDGKRLEEVPGDAKHPWRAERFAIQFEPPRGGTFQVECRAWVRGAEDDVSELRSQPLGVRHEHALEPWMLEYASDASRSPFRGQEITVTASSEESEFHPKGDVLDGLQGSSWWARADDPEPWIRLEATRGIRLKEVWLSTAGSNEVSRDQCLTFPTVELRLNDAKTPIVVTLSEDPRLKTKVTLPKPTLMKKLELRVIDPPYEGGKCVGWAEIEGR